MCRDLKKRCNVNENHEIFNSLTSRQGGNITRLEVLQNLQYASHSIYMGIEPNQYIECPRICSFKWKSAFGCELIICMIFFLNKKLFFLFEISSSMGNDTIKKTS